jgi:replicative DNA helicase
LHHPQVLPEINESLAPSHFASTRNRLIYEAMSEMSHSGTPIDIITLRDALATRGKLEACGGEGYLAGLGVDLPDPARVTVYAKAVRDNAVSRKIYELAGNLRTMKETGTYSLEQLMTKLGTSYEEIVKSASTGERTVTAADAINTLVEHIEDGWVPGIPTGFADLDDMTYGLGDGRLYVLAGRPGMGKTALICNMLRHVCDTCRRTAVMFSMEMGAEELMMRMLSDYTTIPIQRLKEGTLQQEEWDRVAQARREIATWNLRIEDAGSLTPAQLASRSKRIAFEMGDLDVIFVDYLQLMSDPPSGNRNEEVSRITRKLKLLAKDQDVPVVIASQLSRKVEGRVGHRPNLADLRDSGSIEQDADLVGFVYRPGYYKTHDDTFGETELIISKNRSGPPGTVKVFWQPQFTRFSSNRP